MQRAVEEQQFNLREGAEIIIATPGRLKDVLERHVLVLSQCRYVVMDEADRMVHLGFEADLTFILDKLPSGTMEGEDQGEQMDVDGETMVKKGRTRVTTLFSATMPPPVERLAKKYLKRPAIITIGEAGRAVDTVEQRVEFIIGEEKKKYVTRLWMTTGLTKEGPCPQTTPRRNSQQWAVPGSHYRFCQPEKDGGYGRERSFSRWLERCDPAFGQESRTTRGFVAGTPLRYLRRFGRDGPRGSWYRRARCFPCHQLPDGQHNRGLRASYRPNWACG